MFTQKERGPCFLCATSYIRCKRKYHSHSSSIVHPNEVMIVAIKKGISGFFLSSTLAYCNSPKYNFRG